MASPHENEAPINPDAEHHITNEKPIRDSESETRAGSDPDVGDEIAPHTSNHPHFGVNQVISNTGGLEDLAPVEKAGTYDKIEITEDMCYEELGFNFSTYKKW